MRKPQLCLFAFFFHPIIAIAEPVSTISIPASVPYAPLIAAAEAAIPAQLVSESDRNFSGTCVAPERVCTKIPEFRGLKIYSRLECIDVTPRIDCNVTQSVRREGSLTIKGQGQSVQVQQVFRGTVTARGRGEIGKNIRQSADGVAQLTFVITPRVAADWQITADIAHRIQWLERPQAKLFNLIPVTFEGKANEALNKAFATYQAEGKQKDLDRLALKDKITPLWAELQVPVTIPLPGDRFLYLHIRPDTVALAPFDFGAEAVSTRLSLTGRFKLTDQAEPESGPTVLPDLSDAPENPGIALSVPANISLASLSAVAQAQLPAELRVPELRDAALRIEDVTLSEVEGSRLSALISGTFAAPVFGTSAIALRLSGRPVWNSDSRTLALRDATLRVENRLALNWFVTAFTDNAFVTAELEKRLIAPLGEEIDALNASLVTALDKALGDKVRATGAVTLSVADLRIADGLRMTLQAAGGISFGVMDLN